MHLWKGRVSTPQTPHASWVQEHLCKTDVLSKEVNESLTIFPDNLLKHNTWLGGQVSTSRLYKISCNSQVSLASPLQRKKKSVPDHRKNIFWGTFLGSKKNFPGRWWIQKLYKNQESHIYHRNLSSVAPILFGKEKFLAGAGRCMLSFSQLLYLGADFWEVDLDSIFSIFGVRRLTEWPGPLH